VKLFYFLRAVVFTFFVFPLVTAFLSALGAIVFQVTRNRRMVDWCGNAWARSVIFFMGVEVEAKGRENIPKGGCLFLFNHTSFFDIFVMVQDIYGIRFGAKIEFFSIPIFRLALKSAGVLPIARNNREKAIQVLLDAEERARQGERFALAPEGGRNSEEILLPFKSGPFIFAIKAGVPVVPVIIKGAHAAWPKNSFLPCLRHTHEKITVEYLPPIETKEYTVERRGDLSQRVRELMLPFFPGSNP